MLGSELLTAIPSDPESTQTKMCGDLEAYWKSGEDNMPLPPTCLLDKHRWKQNKAFSIPSYKQKARFKV